MKITNSKSKNGNYIAILNIGGGKVRRINLGTRNKDEAMKLAKSANLPTIESLAKADALTDTAIMAVRGKRRNVTLGDAIGMWREDMLTRCSEHSADVACSYVSMLGGKTRPLSDIKAKDVARIVNTDEDVKHSTRQRRLSSCRGFLSYCVSHGLVLEDPSATVRVRRDILTNEQAKSDRYRAWTDNEVVEVLAWIEGEINKLSSSERMNRKLFQSIARLRFWKAAVLIVVETGLRLKDVCLLERRDMDGNVLRAYNRKTGKTVSVPLYNGVKTFFDECDGGLLFPDEAKMMATKQSQTTLSKHFSWIRAKAGLPDECKFHGLRATYTQRELAKGVPLREVQERLGHSSVGMTIRYGGW